jgi:hypothetical protein
LSDPAKSVKRLRDVFRASFCGTGGEIHQAGREVLVNLRAMSGYGSSPFRADPVSMAYAVGQQDVVRHILMMLNIPDEEIYRLTNTVNNAEGSFADD